MIDRTEEEIMKDWVGDINTPVVSVRCITYNHEPYIAQALDGFFMQKTTFPFEVIVHDDASTDKTADIIREYEKKYPNILKPIYQTENQYSKRDGSIGRIMNAACKGKYIAFCEGDDYWIDENKLQIQVDFLEANPEYSAYYSNVEGIDADGNPFDYVYTGFPLYKCHSILKEDSHYYSLIGQIATCMIRGNLYIREREKFVTKANGDVVLALIARAKGHIYYSEKKLACYRKTLLGESWSARVHGKDMSMFYYVSTLDLLTISKNILRKEYSDGNFILSRFIFIKIRSIIFKFQRVDIEEFVKMLKFCDFKLMLPFYFFRHFFVKIFSLKNKPLGYRSRFTR